MPSFEQRLLELATLAGDEAEVYALSTEETPVNFEANRLKGVSSRQSHGVALRLIKGGRIGFAAGSGPTDHQQLVDIAVETAEFGPTAQFHLPRPTAYPVVDAYDPAIETLDVDAMVEAGNQAVDRIVAASSGIVCDAGLTRRIVNVTVLNSTGVVANARRCVFSARLSGTLIRGTDMLFVGDMFASCHPALDLTPLVEATLQQLEWTRETVTAPASGAPVLFTPRGFAQAFSGALSLGLSGKTVLQGSSPLGGRLGETCFDPRLTLVDDPSIAYCPGAQAFDGEGVPSARRVLVNRGRLEGFVYDLQTAAMAGVVSTGNGGRGLTSLPAPDLNVLVVEPGDTSFETMLEEIDDGLVVEEMLGSSQGNLIGGDFSGNVLLGYRVQHGRITGRVKDTMVSGNVYEVLRQLHSVGKDARWVGGSLLLPPISCLNVAISAAG